MAPPPQPPPASASAAASPASAAAVPADSSPRRPFTGLSLRARPDTAFSAGWIVPGTLASAGIGGVAGATVAALDPTRPLFRGCVSAAAKSAVAGFMYFGGVTQITASGLLNFGPVSPTGEQPTSSRIATHAVSGAVAGALLLSAFVGRQSAPRGVLLGLVASLPAWFVLEGRHQLRGDERAAEQRGWMAAAPQPKPAVPGQFGDWHNRALGALPPHLQQQQAAKQ